MLVLVKRGVFLSVHQATGVALRRLREVGVRPEDVRVDVVSDNVLRCGKRRSRKDTMNRIKRCSVVAHQHDTLVRGTTMAAKSPANIGHKKKREKTPPHQTHKLPSTVVLKNRAFVVSPSAFAPTLMRCRVSELPTERALAHQHPASAFRERLDIMQHRAAARRPGVVPAAQGRLDMIQQDASSNEGQKEVQVRRVGARPLPVPH